MKELLKTTEVYKVNDETEAVELIDQYKNNQHVEGYTLTKSGYILKNRKVKGEIVDSWAVVTVEKTKEV